MDFYGYGVETGKIPEEENQESWHIPGFSNWEDSSERVCGMKAKIMKHRFSISSYERLLDFEGTVDSFYFWIY